MNRQIIAQEAAYYAAEYIEAKTPFVLGEAERAKLAKAIEAIINGKKPGSKED